MEYLVVGIIAVWAVYYLWSSFGPQKGCACGKSCGGNASKSGHIGCCETGEYQKKPDGIMDSGSESILGKGPWDWKS